MEPTAQAENFGSLHLAVQKYLLFFITVVNLRKKNECGDMADVSTHEGAGLKGEVATMDHRERLFFIRDQEGI